MSSSPRIALVQHESTVHNWSRRSACHRPHLVPCVVNYSKHDDVSEWGPLARRERPRYVRKVRRVGAQTRALAGLRCDYTVAGATTPAAGSAVIWSVSAS